MTPRQKSLWHYLEGLYERCSRRELVSPDPLQFLYRYEAPEDREIAALVASSLAYGRVAMILKSAGVVLDALGASPRAALEHYGEEHWREVFAAFRHRFTDGADVAALLEGVRRVLSRWDSLGACMLAARRECGTLAGALDFLIAALENGQSNSLLCRPQRGSACKRHFLMLRWLIRCDEVDPGGWIGFDPAELIVPLDTHMYAVCRSLRFTKRKAADLKTAQEVTQAFACLSPRDPVRYDFVLTRFGIRADMEQEALLAECRRRTTTGRIETK